MRFHQDHDVDGSSLGCDFFSWELHLTEKVSINQSSLGKEMYIKTTPEELHNAFTEFFARSSQREHTIG